MADWIVPTDQGRVRVTLDRVPTDLGERNRLITEALEAGRYTPVAPTAGETLLGAARGTVETLAPLALPAATIGLGAARGAAVGAPGGPLPAGVGALLGGVLGGVTGFAGNNAADAVLREVQGLPQKPVGQQLTEVFQGGAMAGAEGAVFNAAAPLTGAFLASRAGQRAAAEATARAARGFGVELTAGEQAGTPFLRSMEAVAARTAGGAGSLKDIGQRQTTQAVRAAEEISEAVTGPVLDQVARSNRFAAALKGRLAELKREAHDKFTTYLRAAGPDSIVDMTPVRAVVQQLEDEFPGSTGSGLFKRVSAMAHQRVSTLDDPVIDAAGVANQPTLARIRQIRSAVDDVAYPDRLGGVAIVDAETAKARRVSHALKTALEGHADARGLRPLLDDANQFYRTFVEGADSRFYAALLQSEKQLGSFSRQLFNPRDTTMLLDAKNLVTPEGWKMIQQQWFDDVFFQTSKSAPAEATPMLFGKQFADRVDRERAVLKILFSPEEYRSISDLAAVIRTASPTMSVARQQDFTRGMVSVFAQGTGAGSALYSIATSGPGVGNVGTLFLSTAAPYLFGKAVTNPTTARIIAAAAKAGRLDATTGEVVVKYLGRAGAIAVNLPDDAIEAGPVR